MRWTCFAEQKIGSRLSNLARLACQTMLICVHAIITGGDVCGVMLQAAIVTSKRVSWINAVGRTPRAFFGVLVHLCTCFCVCVNILLRRAWVH